MFPELDPVIESINATFVVDGDQAIDLSTRLIACIIAVAKMRAQSEPSLEMDNVPSSVYISAAMSQYLVSRICIRNVPLCVMACNNAIRSIVAGEFGSDMQDGTSEPTPCQVIH